VTESAERNQSNLCPEVVAKKVALFKKYMATNFTAFHAERDSDNNNIHERLAMIGNTVRMVQDSPVLGSGIGNWKFLIPTYGQVSFSPYIRLQNPHNDFLWILSESGLLGLTTYVAFLVYLLKCAYAIIRNQTDRIGKLKGFMLLLTVLVFMYISVFGYPRERIQSLCLMALTATLIFINSRQKFKVEIPAVKPVLMALTFFTLFSIVLGAKRLTGEIYLQRALKNQVLNQWQDMQKNAESAGSWAFSVDVFGTPLKWYEGLSEYYGGNRSKAFKAFKDAEKYNPYHLQVLSDIATCYAEESNYSSALQYYKKAYRIYPSAIANNLMAAHYNSGNYREAYQLLTTHDPQNPDMKYAILRKYLESLITASGRAMAPEELRVLNNRDSLINVFEKSQANRSPLLRELHHGR